MPSASWPEFGEEPEEEKNHTVPGVPKSQVRALPTTRQPTEGQRSPRKQGREPEFPKDIINNPPKRSQRSTAENKAIDAPATLTTTADNLSVPPISPILDPQLLSQPSPRPTGTNHSKPLKDQPESIPFLTRIPQPTFPIPKRRVASCSPGTDTPFSVPRASSVPPSTASLHFPRVPSQEPTQFSPLATTQRAQSNPLFARRAPIRQRQGRRALLKQLAEVEPQDRPELATFPKMADEAGPGPSNTKEKETGSSFSVL